MCKAVVSYLQVALLGQYILFSLSTDKHPGTAGERKAELRARKHPSSSASHVDFNLSLKCIQLVNLSLE